MNDELKRAAEKLGESLETLFETRTAAIGVMRNLESLAQVAIQAETLRLEHRLGEDHPKTVAMRSRLEANRKIVHALEIEKEMVSIRPAHVARDHYLLEGRVTESKGRGLPGLTVSLAAPDGPPVREVPSVQTENAGYFAIRIDPELGRKLTDVHRKGVHVVVAHEKAVLYTSPRPIQLAPGRMPFQEIVIGLRGPDKPSPGGPSGPAGPVKDKPKPNPTEPVKPEPVRPEPVRPEPVRPEPVRPAPVPPTPGRIDPTRPPTPVKRLRPDAPKKKK